jgi:hypothetical protein
VNSAALPYSRRPRARRWSVLRALIGSHWLGGRMGDTPAISAAPAKGVRFALPTPALLIAVALVASLSRLRYVISFAGTFGSGDANAIAMHAVFMRLGELHTSPQLAVSGDLFSQPPLIPSLLALLSAASRMPISTVALVVVPLLTTGALLLLTALLARRFCWQLALAAGVMLALLPRFSFDSTEPDKAPFVVSFFIASLVCVYAGTERPKMLLAAGGFCALAMLSHTTGYLFLPVLAGSYVILAGKPLSRSFNRYAAGALLFPAAAVVIYFALAKLVTPHHAFSTPPSTAGDGVLPPFVQTYIDAMSNLTNGAIKDRAWGLYMTGIREQLGILVFALAFAGFARGCYRCVARGERAIAPFLLWVAVITLLFCMQYPAASHRSRYPSYVTPAYVVLAAYFLVGVAQEIRWASAGLLFAVFAACFAAVGYAMAANPANRDFYASHVKAAEFIDEKGLLDSGGALYMDWPSLTLNILERRPEYEDSLYTFGFGQRDLSEFTPQFVASHNIKYYIYDHTGIDAQRSSNVVLAQLEHSMLLRQVARFNGTAGTYTTIYELHPRTSLSNGDRSAVLNAALQNPGRQLLLNPAQCVSGDGTLLGWDLNGWVAVAPMNASTNGCGVLVQNRHEFGGVRQSIDAKGLGGQPVVLTARFAAADAGSARSAVVDLFADYSLVQESKLDLARNDTAFIEAYVPQGARQLRVVLASGNGDEGDLRLLGAALERGSTEQVLADAAATTSG